MIIKENPIGVNMKPIPQSRKELWKSIENELNKPHMGRGQVLAIHLYCELFMNAIYAAFTNKKLEKIERMGFDSKREILYEKEILDETLNKDLKIINQIRNILGHKLFPEKDDLLEPLKDHSNYWAKKVMDQLGTYGKIRFVTIETVPKMLDLYWKLIVKPVLKQKENQ